MVCFAGCCIYNCVLGAGLLDLKNAYELQVEFEIKPMICYIVMQN